jgi:hypothetical protein
MRASTAGHEYVVDFFLKRERLADLLRGMISLRNGRPKDLALETIGKRDAIPCTPRSIPQWLSG